MIVLKEQALPSGRACMDYDRAGALFFLAWFLILILLQDDAGGSLFGGLFLFLLAGIHGLVGPIFGHLDVLCRSLRIGAFRIRFSAVDQIHVGHSVIIILTLFHGSLQHLHAFFDVRAVSIFYVLTHLSTLERIVNLEAYCRLAVANVFISGLPVNETYRVVDFGIVGINLNSFPVVFPRIVKSVHIPVQAGQAFDGIQVSGIFGEHFFVLISRHFCIALVFISVRVRHILIGVDRG